MTDLDRTGEAAPTAPAKADPETLVLRGSPRRAIRFRRGVVIGGAALASTALVGVAWVALKPPTFRIVAEDSGAGDTGAAKPSDALADAPKTYGDVPKLGPPLPGDLGRPILERQRELAAAQATDPALEAARQAEQAAAAERERLAAERKAARESGVLVALRSATPVNAVSPSLADATAPVTPDPTVVPGDAPGVAGDPNRQDRKLAFVRERDATGDLNPHVLQPAASPWMLSAGTVIAASLITGLNSDLPGFVTAQVTENVRDSATGRTTLIPQGSRLIGAYDSVVAFGQRQALVVWQRVVLPNGSSLRLDNMPASDARGFAGLGDKVDLHTWQLLKGVALSTLLGVGTELSIGGEGDLVRAIRESTQQAGSRAGDQIVSRNLNVQPTITVRPGWPLRVVVNKDLVLEPWSG